MEQVVSGPSGYVSASISVPVNTDARVLAFRAFMAGLDGRVGTMLIGPAEKRRAPWAIDPLTGGQITYQGEIGGAQPPYNDGAEFVLGADAPVNATAITVTRQAGGLLVPGQYLSIGNRLHVIVALTTADPVDGATGLAQPGNIGLSIRPWLRSAYPAGTVVEFGRPVCLMRLASDDTGAVELQLSRYGTASLDLVEAF